MFSSWTATLTAVLVFSCCVVTAQAQLVPSDFGVTCLEKGSGAVLWSVSTPGVFCPELSVMGETLVVRTPVRFLKNPERPGVAQVFLDAKTGRVLGPMVDQGESQTILPLSPIGNLTTRDGRQLVFGGGRTRALKVASSGGKTMTVRALETYVDGLQVIDNKALIPFRDWGTVIAWNLDSEAVEWEFDALRSASRVAKNAWSNSTVDGQRVLISFDQQIFSVSPESGTVLWQCRLPRQKVRVHDGPWTAFYRSKDIVLVAVYEDLSAIDLEDGTLLWSFDCGPFGMPRPTVVEDRVFVVTRASEPPGAETSWDHESSLRLPVARVRVDHQHPSGFQVNLVSYADVPEDAILWSDLRRPELPARSAGTSLALRMISTSDSVRYLVDGVRIPDIDLTGLVDENNPVYVRRNRYITKVALLVDGHVYENVRR